MVEAPHKMRRRPAHICRLVAGVPLLGTLTAVNWSIRFTAFIRPQVNKILLNSSGYLSRGYRKIASSL
jgi:hypothetical protein